LTAPDVLIVGAGLIGCAIARSLASDGLEVQVVDRDPPGTRASWAAAGMLAPLAEADEPGAFLDLLRESARRFPALAEELRESTGIEVAYRTEGTLLVSLSPLDESRLERRFLWQSAAGLPVARLSGAEARELEPGLTPRVTAALRFPDDRQVDNRLLTRAMAMGARNTGASFRRGEVAGLLTRGGRAEGLVLRDGEVIPAERVVVAAGSWSGRLEGLPRPLPVRPVHGQLIALAAKSAGIEHVVHAPGAYLVPRRDGRLIVGATTEDTGFRTEVTAAAVERLQSAALATFPALAGAELLETWSGLRPGTPDSLPILGEDPDVSGLFYATGHYRNGILLAPITAEIIADGILRREPRIDVAPFSITRFG
jgi:glycine oxidase